MVACDNGDRAKPDKANEKVFRDPLHDLIALEPGERDFLLSLIDTREVQRLRRIRQLGVSSLTYQGAEHSRFTHSLGVLNTVGDMLNCLSRHQAYEVNVRKLLDSHNCMVLKAAALLHDLGHGPFSHLFEEVLTPEPGERFPLESKIPGHEEWTVRLIESDSPQTEVNRVLCEWHIDPKEVSAVIQKTSELSLAVDMLSSELDADRIDYLLRDSMMTGAQYGVFDVSWLLHVLRVSQIRDVSSGSHESAVKLCVDGSKGTRAIEGYIIARLQMYLQVYYHHTTRAIEALVINILQLVRHLLRESVPIPDLPLELEEVLVRPHDLPIDKYLRLDDFLMMSIFCRWSELEHTEDLTQLIEMCDRLVNRRKPYRYLESSDSSFLVKASALRQHLRETDSSLLFHCHIDQAKNMAYKGILYGMNKGDPDAIANSTIYVLQDGIPVPIESLPDTHVIKALAGQQFGIFRFYYDSSVPGFEPLLREYSLQ